MPSITVASLLDAIYRHVIFNARILELSCVLKDITTTYSMFTSKSSSRYSDEQVNQDRDAVKKKASSKVSYVHVVSFMRWGFLDREALAEHYDKNHSENDADGMMQE